MCTLIGYKNKNRRIIGFNRDIHISRQHTKTISTRDYWYPQDPLGKGSWLGVHRDGTFLCLLYYDVDYQPKGDERSRGHIITSLLENEKHQLDSIDLHQFGPFQLLISNPEFHVYKWNGQMLRQVEIQDEILVLTSSSYGYADYRRNWILSDLSLFSQIDRLFLMNYLAKHQPGDKGEMQICMHGYRSQTTSSVIYEDQSLKRELYITQGAPCSQAYQKVNLFLNTNNDEE
ncbi:MAG: NRDE family protein [Spirochaetes bacterium]|nr:NRDE family protein [Spirochaetota bacterium]